MARSCALLLVGLLCSMALVQQPALAQIAQNDPSAAGNGTAGNGTAGNGTAGNGTAGNGTAGNGTAGNGTAGNGTAGNGQSDFGDVAQFFSGPAPPPGPAFNLGVSPAGEVKRLKYTGTGTTSYSDQAIESSGAVSYACSFGFLSPAFRGAYVGVGSSFYNKGFGCGQCIKVQCDDAACQQPGRPVVAMVVDLCGDCFDADLSIAQPLFKNLTGVAGPSAQISWEWASCGDGIQGNIMMLQKPGGSAYFQAFNFANSRQPVIAVQMNGQLLKHSASGNWWEWNPGQAINPRGPFNLALLSQNKEVLRVSLPQLRSADLGVQFKPT